MCSRCNVWRKDITTVSITFSACVSSKKRKKKRVKVQKKYESELLGIGSGKSGFLFSPRVVRKGSRVSGAEVKCSRIASPDEHCRSCMTLVEIEPFLGLRHVSQQSHACSRPGGDGGGILTLGCQCNSLSPLGSSLTNVAAIVLLAGKLVESIL